MIPIFFRKKRLPCRSVDCSRLLNCLYREQSENIRLSGTGALVIQSSVTSRCVRRSVMSACGHNGTPGTSRCVRRSVMSAMDFHRSVVSACGHNGMTGASRYVRRSVMSTDNFRDSLYYIHYIIL